MQLVQGKSVYTESDSRIGGWQEGALNLDRALASAEAAQPERLGARVWTFSFQENGIQLKF